MTKEKYGMLWQAALTLGAFLLWTVLVCTVDVQPVGPCAATVGFAAVNGFVHRLTGVDMWLYTVTDWLSLIPLAVAAGFAVLGLQQWIRRKSLRKVDPDILILGSFYLTVMAVYIFFEYCVINYRPVLLEENLEASYPSSTTVLVLCVMMTAVPQLRRRIRHPWLNRAVTLAATVFGALMVTGRLLSGVHWVTDIVGGILLSAGLVKLYRFVCGLLRKE